MEYIFYLAPGTLAIISTVYIHFRENKNKQ